MKCRGKWKHYELLQFQRIDERTHVLEIVQEPILDQAKKSIGRMPWHQEPMKDVVNCEKLWGAVSEP